MKKIIVIQHCQSEHHINDLCGGWTDTPLTDHGRRQAQAVAERLKNELDPASFSLYSSDLLRASQTADIIGNYIGLKPNFDTALREHCNGIAAGKTKAWCREHANPIPPAGFDIDRREFPEAETWREFYTRVAKYLDALNESETKDCLIVTHGGTIVNIISWWIRLPVEVITPGTFQPVPGGVTHLTENAWNNRVLKALSDRSHLDKAGS
jgi:broad specificity phosphatase PhoE